MIYPDWTAYIDPEIAKIAIGVESDLEIDVTENDYSVSIEQGTDITASTSCAITPECSSGEIEVVKNQYSIVGDGLYASISGEDAPQWLLNIIDSVVANAVAGGMLDYDLLVQDVRNAIDALDVAQNKYVEKINFDALVDGIIATHLTTLNATWAGTYATIVNLDTAVANADYALTQAITDLTSAYTSEINSRITNIQTAYTNADSALASDITALTSVFQDQESNISGVADAVSGLQTYVGLDEVGSPDGTGILSSITSFSAAFTNLENGVTGPAGDVVYALSNLEQSTLAYADNEGARVESKFEYGSVIGLNNNYYSAGFGLVSTLTGGSGTEGDPYDSEFWINAERLKLTNSNGGTAIPFTIDISPTNPQLTFNGAVSFNSISNVPDYALDSDAQSYANTAQSTAISTAASDATTKANNALSSANSYTNTQISNLDFPDSPSVVTYTYAPTTQNYVEGSIWRHQKTVSVGGVSSTQYDHYISDGGGVWRYIGGTYIDGSKIVTGSISTAMMDVGIALKSSDNKFYINMGTKTLYTEDASGNYLTIKPNEFKAVDHTTGDYAVITSQHIGMADVSTGDYVVMDPGSMSFVDASNPENNLTWINGTLTLPHLCVDTIHVADRAITLHAASFGTMPFWYHSHGDFYRSTLVLNSQGEFTVINLTANAGGLAYIAGDKDNTYIAYYRLNGRVTCNGVQLFTFNISPGGVNVPKTAEVYAHTPSAGINTYAVEVWDTNTTTTGTDGTEVISLYICISEFLK